MEKIRKEATDLWKEIMYLDEEDSGLADNLKIFVRVLSKNNTFKQKLIYDSKEKKNVNTATIDKYLGNSKSANLEFGRSL